jgi:membrane protein
VRAEKIAGRAFGWANRVHVPPRQIELGRLLVQTLKRARQHELPMMASHIAFRLTFAIFPGLIAFLWLTRVLHMEGVLSRLLDLVATVMPSAAQDSFRQQILNPPADQAGGAFSLSAVISVAITVFALASAFHSTGDALDRVCQVENPRWSARRHAISFVAALVVGLLMLVATVLAVAGPDLLSAAGVGPGQQILWSASSWLVVIVCVTVAISLTYRYAPGEPQDRGWASTGSLMASSVWLVYTVLFALYIALFSNPKATYGALAGIAITMVYVYATVFIVLLGAEVNAVLRGTKRRPDET